MIDVSQTRLNAIRRKVEDGSRLSDDDGLALFAPEVDLHFVGRLADAVRRRKNGNVAYYNINVHLNPTNVCEYRCPLCAYSRDAADPTAYVMDDAAMLARGREAVELGATELHIVGGLHPEMSFDWYTGILRSLHEAYPSLHLKAWTAVEIDWFARRTGRSHRSVLEAMIAAGLGSMPGGGAEIFDPEVRRRVSPRKSDAETWLAVHRTAHELGLRTNATMLYGHVETPAQRIDHLVRLRALQDATGGFQAMVPLAFHAEGTELSAEGRAAPSAMDDLRVIAISRLMLDNFDHVKAYWISLGVGAAQVALGYGADDMDGTVRYELIHHEAGSQEPEALSVEQLCGLITEAGFRPVERDSLYRPVVRTRPPGAGL
jgi:aminodeoxyfutalosine synthase